MTLLLPDMDMVIDVDLYKKDYGRQQRIMRYEL